MRARAVDDYIRVAHLYLVEHATLMSELSLYPTEILIGTGVEGGSGD